MVTMRRDVAAAASNSIFDRVDRDSELTSYDIFMRSKQETAASDYGYEAVTVDTHAYSGSDLFGYRKAHVEEPKASTAYADYDEYMRAQIHRKTGGRILSKEEFYQEKFNGESAAQPVGARVRSVPAKSGRMTKAGKIFTAVYVLMVVVAASIIIAVNTGSEGRHSLKASADSSKGEIKALTIESNDIESNAFDDILDSLSNK